MPITAPSPKLGARLLAAFGLSVLLLVAAPPYARAQPALQPATPTASCDRACLSGLLEAYLAALKAHDPSRLPLAADVRFTENGVPLELGDGLWNTIDGVGDYQLPFIDPEDGQAGMFGTVQEDGKWAHFLLRLKVAGGKISEVETIVLRPAENMGFGNPQGMKRRPVFYEDVPEDQRLTRVQLDAMANAYFDTLQQNNGTVFAPFAADCNRIESGVQTTNNSTPSPTGRADPAGIKKMGCEAQFKTGFFRFVTYIRDRRFLIADREKGLIYAAAFFDHKGDMRKVKLTDGRITDAQYDTPWTWQIGELFKVKDGKIQQIEALVMHAPYGMPDIWSGHPAWRPAH
jgi:hypothetical protein